MNVLGIIAEYNPFHNGHQYHLEASKEMAQADCVVCVMSGNFVQRGEPARWDKWSRAQMAVQGGADLVLELPAPFAVNSADQFAYGAVKLLDQLGCITHISFGSEAGELAPLLRAADFFAWENQPFQEALKKHMDEGISFPAARQKAAADVMGDSGASVLQSPNNILAVEYLKQLALRKSPMTPLTVARKGEGYNSPASGLLMSSATAVRKAFEESRRDAWVSLPAETADIIRRYEKHPVVMDDYFQMLRYRIRTASSEELRLLYSASEGLENRLKKATFASRTAEEIIGAVKSKRYTETRIRRLLIHALMGLSREDYAELVESDAMYARVLAFSKGGQALVRRMKKEELSAIPVLTNINKQRLDDKNRRLLEWDILASDLYEMAASLDLQSSSDRVRLPYRKEI